jgi:hypothetical protein
MPEETVTVIDILDLNDPEAESLMFIEDVARRWKTTPLFAARRLRENGVRLVRVPNRLRVRFRDVEALEKARTMYLSPRVAKNKAKWRNALSS